MAGAGMSDSTIVHIDCLLLYGSLSLTLFPCYHASPAVYCIEKYAHTHKSTTVRANPQPLALARLLADSHTAPLAPIILCHSHALHSFVQI